MKLNILNIWTVKVLLPEICNPAMQSKEDAVLEKM